MVASILRILHSGVQDGRLLPSKGQPDISFFTKLFIRAGRFTTQWIRLDFDTLPNFGRSSTITLPQKGHLISRLYLVSTMPDINTVQQQAKQVSGFVGPCFGWTNSLGHAILEEATIDIGGSRIERLDGMLLEVYDEFYSPLEKQILMNKLLCRKDNGFSYKSFGNDSNATTVVSPLPFWFSSGDSALSLPIDALYVDTVKLSIQFQTINALYVSSLLQPLPTITPTPGDAYFGLSNAIFYYNVTTAFMFL